MKPFTTGVGIFWTVCLGAIVVFLFFAMLGAFAPGEVMWLTITLGALGALAVIHFIRVRHALEDGQHLELARAVHAMREHRGF